MGRPSRLTPETFNRIIYAVQLGASFKLAANTGGIAYSTFRKWVKRGEAELERVAEKPGRKVRSKELPYVQFVEQLRQAEAATAMRCLKRLEEASKKGNWRVDAWLLARRYPHEYGRQVTEVTGADGGPVVIEVQWGDTIEQDND